VVVRGAYIKPDFCEVKRFAWQARAAACTLARMEIAHLLLAPATLADAPHRAACARTVSKAKKQLLI
jgi:hypothetical protein